MDDQSSQLYDILALYLYTWLFLEIDFVVWGVIEAKLRHQDIMRCIIKR